MIFGPFGPLAQLVRVPPCHGGGRRFKSGTGRSVRVFVDNVTRKSSEYVTVTQNRCECDAMVAYHLAKVEVAGSSPVIRSRLYLTFPYSSVWQSIRLLTERSQVQILLGERKSI